MKEVKETLIDLLIGLAFWNIVLAVIGGCISKNPERYLCGSLVGFLCGVLMIFHMYHTSDRALDMSVAGAKKYMLMQTILRLFIAASIIAGSIYLRTFVSPVAIFFGIWAVKLSAYTHEPLHYFVTGRTIFKRKDEKVGR